MNLQKMKIAGIMGLTALASLIYTNADAQKIDNPRFTPTTSTNMYAKNPQAIQQGIGVLISTDQKRSNLHNGGEAFFNAEIYFGRKEGQYIGYSEEKIQEPSIFQKQIAGFGWNYRTETFGRNDFSLFMGGQYTFGKQTTKGLPQELSDVLTGYTSEFKLNIGTMIKGDGWNIGIYGGPIITSSFPQTKHPHVVKGVEGYNLGPIKGGHITLAISPNYEAVGEFFGNSFDKLKPKPRPKREHKPSF